MIDLSYTPKPKEPKMSGKTAISMQNVVNNALMNRQGGQAPQANASVKADGFGRSV